MALDIPEMGSVAAPVTLNVFAYVAANPVLNTDPSGRMFPCIGLVTGAGAGFAGYWASTALLNQEFKWDQAVIAAVTGGIGGAACLGGVIQGCVVVSAAASAIQYGLAPGAKTLWGYAASAVVGGAAGRFTFSRTFGGFWFSGPLDLDKALADELGIGIDLLKSGVGNFLRSAFANTLASLGSNAFGSAAAGAEIASGPPNGNRGVNK